MFMSSIALAVASLEGEPPAAQPAATRSHSHTNTAGEIDEDHGPLFLEVTYTSDVMANVAGGRRRGVRYMDNLDIVFEADLDRLAGWRGAEFHLYGIYNNGASISDLAGDTQAVSNIETGVRAVRLYEAWIDQKLGDHVSLRAGLYDLNSEFDALDASGLFVGSAHGIGTDFAQSGENGPSIFPSTSLAARLKVTPADGWAIRAAILDGMPGDPARPARTHIRLGKDEGALVVGEVQAPFGDGKLLLGHWRYTAEFDRLDGGGRDHGNSGSYIRAERNIVRDGDRRIDAFARFGNASGRFNMFDRFVSAGLKFSGWSLAGDTDELGIAVASAFTSRPYRAATGAGSAEVAIEATYRTQIASWFALQPSVQYIRRPSADPTIPDALVIGLRSEISFPLFGK